MNDILELILKLAKENDIVIESTGYNKYKSMKKEVLMITLVRESE